MYCKHLSRSIPIQVIRPCTRAVSVTHTIRYNKYTTLTQYRYKQYNALHVNRCIQRHTRNFASITIPTIADSINEGTVASIETEVGQSVNVDDIVLILETDKVSVDIKSTVSGTIKSIDVNIGDTVKVGDSVISVTEGSVDSSKQKDSKQNDSKKQEANSDKQSDTSATQKSKSDDNKQSQPKSDTKSATQPPCEASHGRTPLIRFTHGRANEQNAQHTQQSTQQQPSKQQTQQPSTKQSDTSINSTFAAVLVADQRFADDNERAYQAYLQLPQKYKRKPLSEAAQIFIDLGGAEDYTSKKQSKAAK